MNSTQLYEQYLGQTAHTSEMAHLDQHIDGHTDSSSGNYYQDQHTDEHTDID